ncbi:hypothetical protein SO802_028411 [Lithocarpus litseifolius]|uniref:RNase H type-1 domain-containing protein n=1 Tax=Lithocarpus litseifolius TaxID=425828 RepID=A0AAW2BSP4_9ROSI
MGQGVSSGQSASGAKSRVYFSPNVDRGKREELCEILGFQSTPNLGKYLGIPIKHPGSSSQDFNFVLERVKQKLAGWKANLLSLAGRSILVKHVSSTIPNYVMQSAHLPSKIIEGIDRVNRNFLWGSSDSGKKMHWVGWSKVTKPKEEKGLGLQSAKGRNLALLAKLNWRLQTEGESLWAKVLKGKYCSTRRVTSRNRDKLSCSRVWTAMKKGAVIFQKGVRWTCGRESNLDFWFDNWSKFGALRQIIQGPISSELMKLKVKDVVSANGWDWSITSFEFPDLVRQDLQAMPFAMASRGEDKLTWKESDNGMFNLGSAYNIATDQVSGDSFRGKWIWKSKVLPRIQSFVWQCYHESIGVREVLNRRGMLLEAQCPLCHTSSESILHALRDCKVVKYIWNQLGENLVSRSFFSSNLKEWLEENGTKQQVIGGHAIPWSIMFLFAIWLIWKHRNQVVFNEQRPNHNLAKQIYHRALEYYSFVGPHKEAITHIYKPVRWRSTTSFLAELWALRDGLNLCLSYNFDVVEVELDAKAIVDAISNPKYTNVFVSPLMEDCRLLVSRIPHIRIRHCYREANRCADGLARLGGLQATDFVMFMCPPMDLVKLLESDFNGLYLHRPCPELLCAS